MINKYQTLLNILDKIRFEAPLRYKKYRPVESDIEKLNQARSRAFIHLFLKVNFGILEFEDREHYIVDKGGDGGVDAYFIDEESEVVYFIQSKFRSNHSNFTEKEIEIKELLKMEIVRIMDGEECGENGNEYNGKIKQMQREVSSTNGIAKYKYSVIVLANLKNINSADLKKLTGGFDAEVFDYEKVYNKIIFPIVSGTYYNKEEICIKINLANRSSDENVTYNVKTEYGSCDITVIFVPISEIGRIMYQYKNSILRYNPRSYLEMKGNVINTNIYNSIVNSKTNDFALLNNGITILSNSTDINSKIGKKGEAQLIINSPQIINGGQTSFTLSRIYEEMVDGIIDSEVFNEKEVLLKIVTLDGDNGLLPLDQHKLIESISKSTNNQSVVSDADRKSNSKVQIVLQANIFNDYNLYYERKRGEYADGIKNGYVNRNQIINRVDFIRLAMSSYYPNLIDGLNPKNITENNLFKDKLFEGILGDGSRYKEFMFMYFSYEILKEIKSEVSKDKKDIYGVSKFGRALRYGDYAVIMINKFRFYNDNFCVDAIKEGILSVLSKWIEFEEYAFNKKTNSNYFNEETSEINYIGYYKSLNLIKDLVDYFKE